MVIFHDFPVRFLGLLTRPGQPRRTAKEGPPGDPGCGEEERKGRGGERPQ